MCNLANRWAELGRELHLITLTEASTDFYRVHPGVERIGLGVDSPSSHLLDAIRGGVRRARELRRALRESEPEAIVAFMDRTNVLTLLATIGLGVPVVVCEQNDPRVCPIPAPWGLLRLATYRLADAIVLLSAEQVPWASRRWGAKRIHVIPNAAPPERLPVAGRTEGPSGQAPQHSEAVASSAGYPAERPDRRILLAIGRLNRQKGFDLLLPAFARTAPRHPEWDLVILGEGPERASIEEQVRDLELDGRVALPGHVARVGDWLEQSDLFVLSSRFEGFPNALLEAMAAGLPVVSFDCPTGPSEIVRHEVDGLLVPPEDVEGLGAALDELMANEEQRKRFGTRGAEGVRRFSVESIVQRWDRLLARVVGE